MPNDQNTTLGSGRKTEELFQALLRSTTVAEQMRSAVEATKRELLDFKSDLERRLEGGVEREMNSVAAHVDNIARGVDLINNALEVLAGMGLQQTLERLGGELAALKITMEEAQGSEKEVVQLLKEQLDRIQARESAEFEVVREVEAKRQARKDDMWETVKPHLITALKWIGVALAGYLTVRFGIQSPQPQVVYQQPPAQEQRVAPKKEPAHNGVMELAPPDPNPFLSPDGATEESDRERETDPSAP